MWQYSTALLHKSEKYERKIPTLRPAKHKKITTGTALARVSCTDVLAKKKLCRIYRGT